MYWLWSLPSRGDERKTRKRSWRDISARVHALSHKYNIYIYIYNIHILYIVIFHDFLTRLPYSSSTSLQQDPLIKHVLNEHVRNPSASSQLWHPRWERENLTIKKAQHQPMILRSLRDADNRQLQTHKSSFHHFCSRWYKNFFRAQ